MKTGMDELYHAQDVVLERVFDAVDDICLLGGTALSRCYLNHRISYDLDFFLGWRFDPLELITNLARHGVRVEFPIIDNREGVAMQIHGYTKVGNTKVKVSFVEDTFYGMFDRTSKKVGNISVVTETLDGLMHRKLRTISGTGTGVDGKVVGGRQTSRDLFDLYVLNMKHEKIPNFIKRINEHGANFPVESYINGLLSINWMELLDGFLDLEPLPPYTVDARLVRESLEDLGELRGSLEAQQGCGLLGPPKADV